MARDAKPAIYHLVIQAKDNVPLERLEAEAYIFRKKMQIHLDNTFGKASCSVTSFSTETIVYKGMVLSELLPKFYKDLIDPDYITQFSIYHRRFSTNTRPRWSLAQPMKFIGHNGEINTYLGNLNWASARE
jgi:glutamate synthase (ferredoxin)